MKNNTAMRVLILLWGDIISTFKTVHQPCSSKQTHESLCRLVLSFCVSLLLWFNIYLAADLLKISETRMRGIFKMCGLT